jgi:mRNA interferase MazF
MVIKQGEVHWLRFHGTGSEPRGRRPAVIIQADTFNDTPINTTIVAICTSNIDLGLMPGNVTLRKGDANLPRRSVVNVTQVLTVDRSRLAGRIGALTAARTQEVLRGMATVLGM